MSARILRGTKVEIAEDLVRIQGEIREAIVFVDDPAPGSRDETHGETDIFAEMRLFMVDVPDFDDSRDAIYSRQEGE